MNPPSATLARLLAEAAELNARGASWEAIAVKVGRRPATCRRWPFRYPGPWLRLFRAAECRLVAEAGAEAVRVLRNLLRSKDEKVCREVARVLVTLRHRQGDPERPGAAVDDPGRLDEYLEGLNDAELHALAQECRAAAAGEGAAADGGAGQPG
jgi:hypothetical protein